MQREETPSTALLKKTHRDYKQDFYSCAYEKMSEKTSRIKLEKKVLIRLNQLDTDAKMMIN